MDDISLEGGDFALGVIGCGKIATAMLLSILESTTHSDSPLKQVLVSSRTSQSLTRLNSTLAEHTDRVDFILGDNVRVAKAADVVILGHKPYMLDGILGVDGMAEAMEGKVVISILAGVRAEQILEKLSRSQNGGEVSSARADARVDANTARTFARAGVKNILAMAYKASESAVEQFLAAFYKAILVTGLSFMEAAAVARRTLRSVPTRHARFGLRLPLCDWFVPVVYSSAPELFLAQSEKVSESPTKQAGRAQTLLDSHIHGRDFDLLRFEKQSLQTAMLYLHGPPGVGKTSFLRYAASYWECTSFLDAVVYLDFSPGRVTSLDGFIGEVTGQLYHSRIIEDTNLGLDHKECGSMKMTLCNVLAEHRIGFIFDGFADLQKSTEEQRANALMSELVQFLMEMQFARLQESQSPSQGHVVILSGRMRQMPEFLQGPTTSSYQLEGLGIKEAADLVHYAMRRPTDSQLERPEHELREVWKVEPLVHLLQGNPAALLQFSRIARDSHLSPWEMYDILHALNPMNRLGSNLFSHPETLLSEFKGLLSTLSKEHFATLLMLAWYWHQGPSVSDFCKQLISSNIASEEITVLTSLQLAASWGYLEFERDGQVSWIHPLFTIFTRILGCSSWLECFSNSGYPWSGFRPSSAATTASNLQSNVEELAPWPEHPVQGLENAVRLTVTVLSSHRTRDLHERYHEYIVLYFSEAERSCIRLSEKFLTEDIEYAGRSEDYNRCKQNFVFVLKLCRGRGVFPLPQHCWPSFVILMQGHFVLKMCNVDEVASIANIYEELLYGAVAYSRCLSGRGAVRQGDLGGILALVSELAEIYRRNIPQVRSRKMEFIDFGSRVMEESEQAFGVSSDPTNTQNKSQFYFIKALILCEDGEDEKSREGFRQALESLCRSMDHEISKRRIQEFLKSKDPEVAKWWRSFLDSAIPRDDKLRDWFDTLMEILSSSFATHQRLEEIEYKAEALERSLDRGNSTRAMGFYSGLVLQSMKSLDFHQALGHLNAQERIAKDHNVYEEYKDNIENAKDFFRLMDGVVSTLQSNTIPRGDEFASLQDSFTRLMESSGNSSPEMAEILKMQQESLVRDVDSTLPHNAAPGILRIGEPMQFLQSRFQAHLQPATRSQEYRQTYLRTIAAVLRAVQKLERAEDDSNEVEIFRCLAELQRLAKEGLSAEFIAASAIAERRKWNTDRLLLDAGPKLESIIEPREPFDADKAYELLLRCERIISLGGDSRPELKDFLRKIQGSKAKVRLVKEKLAAHLGTLLLFNRISHRRVFGKLDSIFPRAAQLDTLTTGPPKPASLLAYGAQYKRIESKS